MHPHPRPTTPVPWPHVALLTLLLAIPSTLSITRQSLWLDEAMSAWFATHAHGWEFVRFRFLIGVTDMPLFHVLLLFWVGLFGDSERALRAINLPFALFFLFSLLTLCRRGSARAWWLPALPFAVFPLLIYYVNECRPYAALLGLSAAATAALITHLHSNSRTSASATAWLCSLLCLAAFAMHLLGLLAPFTLTLYVLFNPSARNRLASTWRRWIAPLAVTLPGYLALGLYYLHIREVGTGLEGSGITAATPGNIPTTWKNIAFTLYEAFGFAGLGPPRNDLRIHATLHSFDGYALSLLLGLIACAALALCIAKLCRNSSPGNTLLLCSTLGLLLLFTASKVVHFGFFGRHAMPLIAILSCAIVLALSERGVPPRTRTLAITFLTLAWTCSSARLLFLYPYGKDDARTALNLATQRHLPILWNAREYDAAYYGGFDPTKLYQPVFTTPLSTSTPHWQRITPLHILSRATPEEAATIAASLPPGPYIFVKGKPDAFDDTGAWSQSIATWHPTLLNHLNGFDVYLITIPTARSDTPDTE